MAQTLCRRDWLKIPLALAYLKPLVASSSNTRLHYRIDVTIAPFGFPIFSRKEVGYGSAQLRTSTREDSEVISFEFGGASLPERTRGIRQIGWFEEELTQSASSIQSSRYFGFISAAPEGAPNKATLALATDSHRSPQYCCAVEGQLSDDRTAFTKTYNALLPPDASFSSLPGLRHIIRRSLAEICSTSCLNGSHTANPRKTFLSVLVEAALGSASTLKTSYQYGDRVLRFESTRQNISGQIVVDAEVLGKSRHRFSFTCADTRKPSLPLRVDYQPKPWLRLALVAAPDPKESA